MEFIGRRELGIRALHLTLGAACAWTELWENAHRQWGVGHIPTADTEALCCVEL
jgi:hypothetical protein